MELNLILILIVLFFLESYAWGSGIIKILKRKSAFDYSLKKEVVGFVIVFSWLIAGIYQNNLFLLIGTLFDLIPRTVLILTVIFYGGWNVPFLSRNSKN